MRATLSVTGCQCVELTVNGERRRAAARGSDVLLYTLREGLGLTGAKPGCENGDCGACTVLLDGGPVKSCLVLTAEAIGHEVTTVEGLGMAPVQRAFIDQCAFQCGYCTSGFLTVAHALVTTHPRADGERQLEWLRSNICRCTGYEEIQAAVRSVLADSARRDGRANGTVATGQARPDGRANGWPGARHDGRAAPQGRRGAAPEHARRSAGGERDGGPRQAGRSGRPRGRQHPAPATPGS